MPLYFSLRARAKSLLRRDVRAHFSSLASFLFGPPFKFPKFEPTATNHSFRTYTHSLHRRYDDGGPNLVLCLEAQRYYERHAPKTRVKAAGLLTVSEAKKLAGVSSVTVAPALLRTLAETQGDGAAAWRESLFFKDPLEGKDAGAGIGDFSGPHRQSFLDDEKGYREAFALRDAGKGEAKTKQVSLPFIWAFPADARRGLIGDPLFSK